MVKIALAAVAALAIVLISEPVILYGKVTHVCVTPDVSPAIYGALSWSH